MLGKIIKVKYWDENELRFLIGRLIFENAQYIRIKGLKDGKEFDIYHSQIHLKKEVDR